jgi:dipeptidyl aminopeptidase/acylaminoacyl peptidase
MAMTGRRRAISAVAAAVLLAAVAAGFTALRAGHDAGVTLGGSGLLIREASSGRLAVLSADGRRTLTALECGRLYAAGGTGACLRGDIGSAQLVVLDRRLGQRRTVPLSGVPNRVRVSGSGRMVSWTLMVTPDSYSSDHFSTRTGVLDTRTGRVVDSLEHFTVQDGRPAQDANFWGVTFAADDNRFYATMSTGGHRYLMEGDFARRVMRKVKENVECPSLSPDGKRLAYKKMLPDRTWRLTVLRLSDLAETPLAETRSVDDQAAWLDGRTVAYGLPNARGGMDVWTVPADGAGTPRLRAADAESPAPLPGVTAR